MKAKRALCLSEEEIERRCAMVNLHYGIYRRARARNFGEWLAAQDLIDKAWAVITGHSRRAYTYLTDQELIFPNVMRCFNGRELED